MHRTERWESFEAATRAGLDEVQSRIWTKLPVKVTAVDDLSGKQIVTVQPLVKLRQRVRGSDGRLKWEDKSWPPLPMVPVKFPSGGGWTMTFPIKVGDEGTVSFSSRCIDNWWQGGGEQPQVTSNGQGSTRQHDPSDGFFEMGGRSLPNVLPNVNGNSAQWRSDDGTKYVQFDDDGFLIVLPGGTMRFDASGNLHVSGDVVAGFGGTDQISVQQHLHTHASGPSDSGPPKAGT